ncbi:MAG TPA: Crp/Fnr family transcriptional regulator [Capsulimonadaceae bacterium]|jgi:CRP/FNR family transcriptional regulator
MERNDALRRIVFLRPLPDDVIHAIADAGRVQSLQAREFLFAENAPCLGLVVVLEGSIRIYTTDSRGRELTLGLERPGASVAELPLFDGGNYPASAEADKDGATVLIVPRNRFQELMKSHPEIAIHAVRALAIRMRKQLQMINAQTMHTVRARLASYLITAGNGRQSFKLADTNESIASQIGTVRDVVSRTLGALRESGVIAVTGRTVTILDPAALSMIATSGEV